MLQIHFYLVLFHKIKTQILVEYSLQIRLLWTPFAKKVKANASADGKRSDDDPHIVSVQDNSNRGGGQKQKMTANCKQSVRHRADITSRRFE
ncbi:hypothetical protein DPMN_027739 [Dreissena polymorpha]|uniref:Uncharacterized protein n=1 Tax=Dreissena polymorpha TaxID=45954 RepID=A0A9D4LVT5_DREPO|nr:hypothetical protein DPMN_027739 [Dreissena polymorpha]